MPQIVGVIERLGYLLYSGWIADKRPGGVGISEQTTFRPNLKLFTTDLGDTFRTNMCLSGQLVADRTCMVSRVGFHASFTDPKNYNRFFEGVSLHFVVGEDGDRFKSNVPASFDARKINPEAGIETDRGGVPYPVYRHGITLFEPERKGEFGPHEGEVVAKNERRKPIAIPPRQTFHMLLRSDERFTASMNRIEQSTLDNSSYAEVTGLLDATMTREVQ